MIARLVRSARNTRGVALLVAFAAAGTASGALSGVFTPIHAQEMGLEIGANGPDAALETLDSAAVKLSSVITGKPAVIYFWATWCSNCRELEPAMSAAFEKHRANVAFAAVAVSVNQSTERVRRYTATHYVGWSHFYDRRGNGVEVYDVPATSYVVVLDRTGKVVYTGSGGKQDIEAAIQKALK
jgi:thiol-disulfide isomerase/thioredoxin